MIRSVLNIYNTRMSNTVKFKDITIGVADKVKVTQKISEAGKERRQIFAGTVIKINGDNKNKSITVRKIGANLIGIEKIYPLDSPSIEDVVVTRSGVKGARHSKLYFIRNKSKKEIDKFYSRVNKKK